MKPIKLVRSRRTIWKQRCFRDPKQYKLNVLKGDKDKLLKLKSNKSVIKIRKPQENEKSKNEINEKLQQNKSNIKKINRISSKIMFSRKFSRYKDVQKKLKPKFKSTYKSSGNFNELSTNYNAYVNSNQNKKYKSYLKYSMCNFNHNCHIKEVKKKKSGVLCQELPGKGTYNHRFAYDTALKFHQKGIDVNVLYKVKNKTDSIYVINGEFLLSSDKRSRRNKSKQSRSKSQDNINDDKENSDGQKLIDKEEAQWLEELAKTQEENKKRNKRLAKIALMEKAKLERERKSKKEDLKRKQKLRETEKKLRADKINKLLKAKELREEMNNKPPVVDDLLDEEKNKNKLKESRSKLRLPPNIFLNKRNNYTTNCIKPENRSVEHVMINDCNFINDIKKWVLRNDGMTCPMSWLKIVACRIDSLDERVHKSYKSKWMQLAIDEVVDIMATDRLCVNREDVGHRKCTYRNNVQVSSSFVIQTKRSPKCFNMQKPSYTALHKSPKFSICPFGTDDGNLYSNGLKMKQSSCFQVINVDTFGSRRCDDRTN